MNIYLDLYSSTYEKVIIWGDFNTDTEEKYLKCFWNTSKLKSLIKLPTGYNNPDSLVCINVLLINAPKSFQMCFRNMVVIFSFIDFDCYEKMFQEVTT